MVFRVAIFFAIFINLHFSSSFEDETFSDVSEPLNLDDHKVLQDCHHEDYRSYLRCLKRHKRHHEITGSSRSCLEDCTMNNCSTSKCVHDCYTRCKKKITEIYSKITEVESECSSGKCDNPSLVPNITTNVNIHFGSNGHNGPSGSNFPGEPNGPGGPNRPVGTKGIVGPNGPGGPNKPGEPNKSGEPNKPGNPNKPGEPNKPGGPNKSGEPNKPGEANGLSGPKSPGGPNNPGGSNKPGGPNIPDGSNRPNESDEPRGLNRPGGPKGSYDDINNSSKITINNMITNLQTGPQNSNCVCPGCNCWSLFPQITIGFGPGPTGVGCCYPQPCTCYQQSQQNDCSSCGNPFFKAKCEITCQNFNGSIKNATKINPARPTY